MKEKMNKLFKYVLWGSFIISLSFFWMDVSPAEAVETQRRIEEKKRKSLDNLTATFKKTYRRLTFEYGGWINYRYIDFDDDDNDSSTADSFDDTYSVDGRVWMKAALKPPQGASYTNEHLLYIRLKDLYVERNGDTSVEPSDHDGLHLDYGYFIFDFKPVKVELGRRYFKIGRGIAYSNVNDGVQINYYLPSWNFAGLFSQTLPHEDNIDASVPGGDKESDRKFAGVGAGYTGIKNHQFYGYVLVQRDFSDERPNNSLQQFTYDSEYIGVGSLGSIDKKFNYWIEVIKQYGDSHIFGTNEKADIDAWGANVGIEKSWQLITHPKLTFEYAFGSGDRDRIDVTDTEFGNTLGDDKNFLYFGYIPTGFALAPRLSNLHMVRLGFQLKPLEGISFFRNFSFGLDYYYFQKHRAAGGISDLDATVADKDIGHEIDVYFDWQVLSDLNVSLEYGYFMPGDAYADFTDDNEDYFSISLAYTF